MIKIAVLGLSAAWKTGLIVGGCLLAGSAATEVAHAVFDGRKKKPALGAPVAAK